MKAKRRTVLMMSDLQSGAQEVSYVTDAATLESEIETLRAQWQQLNDQYMAQKAQVVTLEESHRTDAQEIQALRAALKVAQQAILEFKHAQEDGPSWYTRGEQGMYGYITLWLSRGLKAVQGALGPYDDNGVYEKEKP